MDQIQLDLPLTLDLSGETTLLTQDVFADVLTQGIHHQILKHVGNGVTACVANRLVRSASRDVLCTG